MNGGHLKGKLGEDDVELLFGFVDKKYSVAKIAKEFEIDRKTVYYYIGKGRSYFRAKFRKIKRNKQSRISRKQLRKGTKNFRFKMAPVKDENGNVILKPEILNKGKNYRDYIDVYKEKQKRYNKKKDKET